MFKGSLTSLLSQKSKSNKKLDKITSIFEQKIPEPEEPVFDEDGNLPFIDENASALLNKDRTERTIFVGNIDVKAKKKEIKRFFDKFGAIEKLWERSLPVNSESKLPLKAKAIVKDFAKDVINPTKNCYILFQEKESKEKALHANNELFMNRHLRVDSCGGDIKQRDYDATVFIGNLPYQINEETLREHFSNCGEILNIRVIRDSATHIGKGFGYIRFSDKDAYKRALTLNNSIYEKRQLRVRRALDPESLEEKNLKKETLDIRYNKKNAERRMKLKHEKSMTSLKGFAKNDTLEKNQWEDVEFKNIINLNRQSIRKKIRKGLGNATQEQKTEYRKQADIKVGLKHDRNLFNDEDLMETRRKLRKKKALLNSKKLKTERL